MALPHQASFELIDSHAVEKMDPRLASKYRVVPLRWTGKKLELLAASALNLENLDALRYALGVDIEVRVGSPQEMGQALERYDAALSGRATLLEVSLKSEKSHNTQEELENKELDAPLAQMVQTILLEARVLGASDIHLEPMRGRLRLRYRIDGILREMRDPPYPLHTAMINHLKIASHLNIAQKRLPQDGRMRLEVAQSQKLDIRVSTLPTIHGESMVLRLLDSSTRQLGLCELGLSFENQLQVEKILRSADGMLLVTGPTGSGKSTTLYTCLQQFKPESYKMITVEDPIEYQLAGVNQVQVNAAVNMSFAKALRSILRQAPNIIMIGEIRDRETASIAAHAAQTGHLVLSTLHTNDASSAMIRMRDLGVPAFLLASCLRAVLAQRLVRRLCAKCRQAHALDEEISLLLRSLKISPLPQEIYHAQGCETCQGSGYKGRIGLFELLSVDQSMSFLIHQNESLETLRQEAHRQGMQNLRTDGIAKALAGLTTFQEILAATCLDAE